MTPVVPIDLQRAAEEPVVLAIRPRRAFIVVDPAAREMCG